MYLENFWQKWSNEDDIPLPIIRNSLNECELLLGFRFPSEYREEVISFGLPRPTTKLLDVIVDNDLAIYGLSHFYSPPEIVNMTGNLHEAGMPEQLVAFASDDCGNQFCFNNRQIGSDRADSMAVWFFDHDLGTIEQIYPSFASWMSALCSI